MWYAIIKIVNLKNSVVEQELPEAQIGVMGTRFFKNNQNSEVFLLSNRPYQIVFWDANGLNPFYGKIMGKEVDAKMNEWVKMMQGESMEDYAIRVNDESRLKQQQLFAQEVATELAGDRISIDNPFVILRATCLISVLRSYPLSHWKFRQAKQEISMMRRI